MFANVVPNQPLPTIDDSCTALLGLAASLDARTSGAGLEAAVQGLRSSQVAQRAQEWLVAHHHSPPTYDDEDKNKDTKEEDESGTKGNVYTHSFFSALHLKNRDPLPFGENYSVLLSPLTCKTATATGHHHHHAGPSSMVEMAACVARAALDFWAGLSGPLEEQRLTFLRKVEGKTWSGELPESSQYYDLFGSARLPATECDEQLFAPVFPHHHRRGKEVSQDQQFVFVIARKGHFFAVSLRPCPHSALGVPSISDLALTLRAIAEKADALCCKGSGNGSRLMGLLTCMERDDAAKWRNRLAVQPNTQQVLTTIQGALFLLALDETVQESTENAQDDDIEIVTDGIRTEDTLQMRQLYSLLNGVPNLEGEGECNRWFEKGIQIIVADAKHESKENNLGPGQLWVGINVEHSFADSGAVHKMASFVWEEAQSYLMSDASLAGSSSAAPLEWQQLEWDAIEDDLAQRLLAVKDSILVEAQASLTKTIVCKIRGIGRQFFKNNLVSPDCCFQIGTLLPLIVAEHNHLTRITASLSLPVI